MKIKAIIFDLDGTLVDSERIYRKVWPIAFKHFGFELSTKQNYDLMSLGDPYLTRALHKWFGKNIDFSAIDAYAYEWQNKYYKIHKLKAMKGMKKSLAYLKNKGFKLAVATCSKMPAAIKKLEETDLLKYFDSIISASNVKRAKPSGDTYRYVLKQLKLKPSEAIAIEDSSNGLLSANDAKIFTILIPDLIKPKIDKNNKLVKVIKDGNELIKTINELIF